MTARGLSLSRFAWWARRPRRRKRLLSGSYWNAILQKRVHLWGVLSIRARLRSALLRILTCCSLPGCPYRSYYARKAFTIQCLCDHRGVWHLFVNTLDGIVVGVCSDEDDRHVAHFAKPSGSFDPFAASLQINVHQDDIWQILHCLQECVLCVCCYIASVETQRLHVYCQAHSEQIFIVDDQCATLRT